MPVIEGLFEEKRIIPNLFPEIKTTIIPNLFEEEPEAERKPIISFPSIAEEVKELPIARRAMATALGPIGLVTPEGRKMLSAGFRTALEGWRRITEMVKAPLFEYQRAVIEGRPKKEPIGRAIEEAAKGFRVTSGTEIIKNMGVPLDDPDWVLKNPGKHFAAQMLGAWYETYGTDPIILTAWARSIPYARKAALFGQLIKETGQKVSPALIGKAKVPISPKLAKKLSTHFGKGFWGRQTQIAGGLKKVTEGELKQAIKAVRSMKYVARPAPMKSAPPAGIAPVARPPVRPPAPVAPRVTPPTPVTPVPITKPEVLIRPDIIKVNPLNIEPPAVKLLEGPIEGVGFIMRPGAPARRVPKGEVGQVFRTTPPPPDNAFGVKQSFLEQPKPKTTILQYFTPAEYHLKQLGFDAEIGQPIREALRNFSIELLKKNDFVINTQKFQRIALKERNTKLRAKGKRPIPKEAVELKIWNMMDKSVPKIDKSLEAKISRRYRKETEEMLTRMNETRKLVGKEEIKGIKNYILHMLKPEILNEIYSTGVIPSELAKVMEYIPPKNLFLRTAQQRKGVPEEWLIKDPHALMKAMYAIDLKYIHLQEALHKVDPYLKAVKGYRAETPEGMVDEWSPESYKYIDDWIKQAIKMRPSNWDILINNIMEYTLAPVLRKAGVKVSHMPWRDFVSTLSAGAHTGALGMRIKPVLRNLVQSTFDWVMYGTKPYLKGSRAFMTKKGFDILKQSKVWQTRMPYEAQDLATLKGIFRKGSLAYRGADLHNVGKGLLTRYHHAIDRLGMSPEEAIRWADEDLPGTQWSYRREDLPRAYWTSTGRAFWTLGSWWMNFYTRFLPEILKRTFQGMDVTGRAVPFSERMAGIRLLILIGILFGVKKASKEITGTVIDYTGQVKPTPLRESPIASLGEAFIKVAQGFSDNNERLRKEGLKEIGRTGKIFIPWWLAGEDLFNLISGKKKPQEVILYGRQKKEIKATGRPLRFKARKIPRRF